TGMILAGVLAVRLIPELRTLALRSADSERRGTSRAGDSLPIGRIAGPRIVAAAIACVVLSQWGVAVGTLVGWQASTAMMGLPTETFFLMLTRMLWFRDVVGLIVKGLLFGVLAGAICCFEGFYNAIGDGSDPECSPRAAQAAESRLPLAGPILRAT